MDDDDYPNFGNAFPTQTTSTSTDGQGSWNPALRPNGHHRRNESRMTNGDDDFFERYPGPTPEKSRRPPTHEEDEAISPTEVEPAIDAQRTPERAETAENMHDEESAFLEHEATVEEQAEVLEQLPPKEDDISTRPDGQEASEPAAHYEHQGEVTELEEALDESVKAPLIKDEQPLPTVSTFSRAPTFATEDEERPIRGVQRSFTTNFTDVPEPSTTAPEENKVPSDWPAVGDDKTFAELLDSESAIQPAEAEYSAAPATVNGEQDLTAAWAAALDDDDILEETNELDPTSFFGDDDEDGFLEDEPVAPVVQPMRPLQQQRSASAYVPNTTAVGQTQFGAPASRFIDQSHGRSMGTPSTGLFDLYSQPPANAAQAQPSRPALSSTQSFVDRGKNGYQSPYDLPMDVIKTRRRPANTTQNSQASLPVPPPRTSSFGVPAQEQIAGPSPPNSRDGLPDSSSGTSSTITSAKPTPKSDAGFFADLPMTAKPRPRASGAYSPHPTGIPTPPLSSSQQQFPVRQSSPVHAPPLRSAPSYAPPQSQQPSMVAGLRQPEKVSLFPDQITPPSTMQNQAVTSPPTLTPQTSNRYSPAPQTTSQAAANTARYSPAPPGSAMKSAQRYSSSPGAAPSLPPSRASQSFVPRTSSPLAVHGRPQLHSEPSTGYIPGSPGKPFDAGFSADRRGSSTSRYAPSVASTNAESAPGDAGTLSPRRQRTRSPSEFRKLPTLAPMPVASAITAQSHGKMHLTHKRQFSRDLPYAAPNDERAQDPLERWKGHPIFYWSAAGNVTSSFPKHTPFYASGAGGPSVKCTPGDIKVTDASTVLPLDARDAKFPGPLPARSKGKKKDLLAWLVGKVEDMQQAFEASRLNFDIPEKERRCNEEKLLLWQLMRVYLEHDGVLEGSPKIEEEVRRLLMPDLAQKAQVMEIQSPVSATAAGEAVDRSVIHQIQLALFEGQREKAVWLAEEKRLWGHAMLIASTMGPDTFKQIVASFVRSQVKSQGGSELKSLASLYQVFAGSPDECVDELVPPSARAGFQMISTTDGRGTADSLSGLDQWRDTLSLVQSNPTAGNSASLLAIGKLLASYERIEAAHVCFLFSRKLAKHAGLDDAEAHFVLLGSDPASGSVDLDSLMLTEIYEYATSLSAPATTTQYIPHLQAYKLAHARSLAASGHKGQAQSYCEHIDAAIRSTTRPSGYYHQAFAQELMSFNALLSQTPHSGSQGGKFFSQPTIGKVSSNVGSWFTKFVSGAEDGETDSNASIQGGNEAESFGPFGGVSGNSGPISRTASSAELYSGVPTQPFQPSSMPNRYTPLSQGSASKYAPAGAARTSFDPDRSLPAPGPSTMPSSQPIRSASARYAPKSGGESPAMLGVQPTAISRRASNQSLASTGSYEPKPLLAEHDGFGFTSAGEGAVSTESHPVEPSTNGVSHDEHAEPGFDPEAGGGYAPPSMAYEPPSYQPYQPEPEQAEEETAKPKKKSFMDDDDDDITARAATLKSTPASRDPDPAIVAAAAADAARQGKGHASKESGSWFGGWFGKKDPSAPQGPIKAKLGEESSFYFDKDLNKWVNKKGGSESATASAPTPPPPRAPGTPMSGTPSRVASGGPPAPMSGPPSRQGTPANGPPSLGLPPKSMPTASSALGSMAPPPRPMSSMSTASSLDDLLGGPPGAGKKSGTAKGKKKGRYVDVMASGN